MKSIHQPDAQGFISGVYNYCDRRCERCRFQMQCRIGRVEADDAEFEDENDPSGLPSTHEQRFRKMMEDLVGPDTEEDEDSEDQEWTPPVYDPADEDPEEVAAYERKQETIDARTAAHPLTNYGETYMELSMAWTQAREAKFKALGFDLSERVDMGMAALPAEKLLLREAIDELLWFQTMLHVKLQRAIHGKFADPDLDDAIGLPVEMSDWNGTAKLCLHMVERCTDAWDTVEEMVPEEAMDVAPLQELLKRIKQALGTEFPDAPKFIRAGWDAEMGEPPEWT